MAQYDQVFLHPGQVYFTTHPACVSTVCGPGVVCCLWDADHRWGGICHYVLADQPRGLRPTPSYGPVALRTLVRLMRERGTVARELEAKVFGGAAPPKRNGQLAAIAERNVAFAYDELDRRQIAVKREDVGGHRGRKIVYYSESNLAKVLRAESIRERDWFAPLDALRARS